MSDNAQSQPGEKHWLFKKGQSGNPAGKPKGTRQRIASTFLNDLQTVWDEQGEAAIRRMAFSEPGKFVEVVAKLLPQKIEIETPTSGLSLERMQELMDLAERMIALRQAATALPVAPQRIEGAPGGFIEGEVTKREGGEGPFLPPSSGGESTGTSSASAPQTQHPSVAGRFSPGDDLPLTPMRDLAALVMGPPDQVAEPPISLDGEEEIDIASLF